jgi:hypothetical protein
MDTITALIYGVIGIVLFAISIKFLIDGWKMVVKKKKILLLTSRISLLNAKLIRGKEFAESQKQKFLSPFYVKVFGIIALLSGMVIFVFSALFVNIYIKILIRGYR